MADVEKATGDQAATMKDLAQTSSHALDADTESGSHEYVAIDDGGTAADAQDMRRMGKLQELRRDFQAVSATGFTCAVMGTWEILYLQNTQSLIDGGRAGMFWSMVWSYAGQVFVVLSLAEMASMAPTAGGQYHWVSEFAPPRLQKVLSYTSGWLSMLAWQLFVTADHSLFAALVLALAALHDPSFVIQPWMNTTLIIAFVCVVALLNIFAVRWFPRFESLFIGLHVACFFVVIAVLWAYGDRSTPARDVFLDFADYNPPGTAWPTIGLTLLVGQAPGLFTIQASDSVAHIAEEVQDAGLVVPRTMLVAFFGNMPLALGLLVTYVCTVGDVGAATSSPTGFPFIYALQNGSRDGNPLPLAGVTAVVVLMLILMFFITISTTMSTSRQTFAFARDRGTPFARWVGRVSTSRQTPANSVIVTGAFTALLSLIYLGSAVAFNAFISASVVALMSTYVISIGCVLVRRIKADHYGGPKLPPARWSLGRFGVAVNVLGLLFCLQGFFWCFWPIANTTDPKLFNWAVAIFAGIALIALLQFVLVARRVYDGPVTKVRQD